MDERLIFKSLQVLIVGAKPHAVQILRQALGIAGVQNIAAVANPDEALERLRLDYFDCIFCDAIDARVGGKSFVLAVRAADGVLNPTVPIFLTSAGARRRDVEAARDLGVSDVLARPFSAGTLQRKLRLALRKPRKFIKAGDFIGPDRRAKARIWRGEADRRAPPQGEDSTFI